MMSEKVSYKKVILYSSVIAFVCWVVFGIVMPNVLLYCGYLNQEYMQALSPYGDMFGGANSLFASFALVMLVFSIIIQYRSFTLQQEQLIQQGDILKNTLAMQIIMPLMDEIGGDDMRQAILVLKKFQKNSSDFEKKFKTYKADDNAKDDELAEVDKARRKFIKVFHTITSLYAANIIDLATIRAFIGADYIWILKNISEPLERAIRDNYSKDMFILADKLYTQAQIDEYGAHKKNN